jgi:hypothetical protein
MDDLRRRFADLDALPVPDLWPDIERRASSPATESVRPQISWRREGGRRALSSMTLVLLVGLVVVSGGSAVLIGSWLNGPTPSAAVSTAPVTTVTTVTGCIVRQEFFAPGSIGAAECDLVAAEALAQLPNDRGRPLAILVHLSLCPDECHGPNAFQGGSATIEYADGGEPVVLTIHGSLEAPEFETDDSRMWSGLQRPTSRNVDGPGPFPFSLGHCGLTWYVDFDGSFWVPVGLIDGSGSGVVNQEQGEMRLIEPDLAQFIGESGFTAKLARFPGAKHIWICS